MKAFSYIQTVILLLTIGNIAFCKQKIYQSNHCIVTYENISPKYAQAICQTAVKARKVAIDQFGFDMPEIIKISIKCVSNEKTALFNDGNDRFYLTVKSENDLRKPSISGIYHIYGICHEVGHLAMYRIIRNHSWCTTAAAEGWAHYIGSRIVDDVYASEGDALWPEPYDYSLYGMKRLKKELTRSRVNETSKGAGQWSKLAMIVGDEKLIDILKVWSKTEIDPADPAPALGQALVKTSDDVRLPKWWKRTERLFVAAKTKSHFTVQTVDPTELAGQTLILANDDGQQSGRKSIAGSSHNVRFKVEGGNWYLTNIQIYGSRYGGSISPQDTFHIWFCDTRFNVIADFTQPYSKFNIGTPGWVDFPVQPTKVPSNFFICVGFNPTATKGIYVGFDASPKRHSFTGLPGKKILPFKEGDWMIRASVDQLKITNSFSPPD